MEPKGLLLVDPLLYMIIPFISRGKLMQLAVWETILSTNKQYRVHSTYADTLKVTHSRLHHYHTS